MNSSFNALSISPVAPAARPGFAAPSWLVKVGGAVLKALAASSEARARRHILDFASQCEGLQPELAKELRAASHQIPAA
jgi:hypothetical protein